MPKPPQEEVDGVIIVLMISQLLLDPSLIPSHGLEALTSISIGAGTRSIEEEGQGAPNGALPRI